MRIFVLTATYELRVSRKSHLRDHPTQQRMTLKVAVTQERLHARMDDDSLESCKSREGRSEKVVP
jgi:hypothetical protein